MTSAREIKFQNFAGGRKGRGRKRQGHHLPHLSWDVKDSSGKMAAVMLFCGDYPPLFHVAFEIKDTECSESESLKQLVTGFLVADGLMLACNKR